MAFSYPFRIDDLLRYFRMVHGSPEPIGTWDSVALPVYGLRWHSWLYIYYPHPSPRRAPTFTTYHHSRRDLYTLYSMVDRVDRDFSTALWNQGKRLFQLPNLRDKPAVHRKYPQHPGMADAK